jgi:hypothetical protein
MPNDPGHELHHIPPELSADQVRDIGDRTAAETEEEKAKSFDRMRQTYAVLKRADEILAKR